ncbi:hypothetical protein J2S34_003709 [Nitrobacter winogradskyi]|uniref:Uncharacterized protein n=2 Tax=Nitrobacter winogradskyi TaxID=913 RepID=A0ACC6AMY4_NITWI|nr:hypothetical protein [Nitrobacter winogradskyi]MCP2001223.1 hypothetical protein [Nitrobacter winogradskyi]GEC17429.1 hypothetical protein NWI01_33210 [Nitrobacter winogradskyi]
MPTVTLIEEREPRVAAQLGDLLPREDRKRGTPNKQREPANNGGR